MEGKGNPWDIKRKTLYTKPSKDISWVNFDKAFNGKPRRQRKFWGVKIRRFLKPTCCYFLNPGGMCYPKETKEVVLEQSKYPYISLPQRGKWRAVVCRLFPFFSLSLLFARGKRNQRRTKKSPKGSFFLLFAYFFPEGNKLPFGDEKKTKEEKNSPSGTKKKRRGVKQCNFFRHFFLWKKTRKKICLLFRSPLVSFASGKK
jgi:hypothetical protein